MSSKQLELQPPAPGGFSRARHVPRHAINHAPSNVTSAAAEKSNRERRPSQREVVYLYILGQGDRGATRKEIAANTGISENAVRPRVLELTGAKDETTGGWRAFETGMAVDQRDGCNVVYAGPYAIEAQRRLCKAEAPEALAVFERRLERHREQAIRAGQ